MVVLQIQHVNSGLSFLCNHEENLLYTTQFLNIFSFKMFVTYNFVQTVSLAKKFSIRACLRLCIFF